MTDLNHALDSLRSWATNQRAILALADALEGVGSIKGAAQEAQAALDGKRAELASVGQELAQANAELGLVKEEASRVLNEAIEAANETAAKAANEAAALVLGAEDHVATLMEAAQASAAQVKAEADASVKESLGAVARIEISRDEALASATEAAKELTGLQDKIAAARETISKLLGSNA